MGIEVSSREENLDMLRRYKNGEKNLRDEIILRNIPLINFIARKYISHIQGTIISFEDLISEGILAIMDSIEKFDINGEAFNHYISLAIERKIMRYIYCNKSSYRKPISLQHTISAAFIKKDELERKLGRTSTKKELMSCLGIDDKKYYKIFCNNEKVISLNESFEDEEKCTMEDFIASEDNTEEQALKKFDKEELLYLLDNDLLTEKEKIILKKTYIELIPIPKIALSENLTNQRIHQLQIRALNKLKRYLLESSSCNINSELVSKIKNKLNDNFSLLDKKSFQEYFNLSSKEMLIIELSLGIYFHRPCRKQFIANELNISISYINDVLIKVYDKLSKTKTLK